MFVSHPFELLNALPTFVTKIPMALTPLVLMDMQPQPVNEKMITRIMVEAPSKLGVRILLKDACHDFVFLVIPHYYGP